jgi:hypothetical protein
MLTRLLQSAKQNRARVSTDEGIEIDDSDKHPRNAESSILESLASNSKLTRERFVHDSKHDRQIVWTEEGMTIEESAQHL